MKIKKLMIGGDPTGIVISMTERFSERALGLMFKRIVDGSALLIDKCASIHTFFMLSPIDAVFLDKRHSIVRIISNLKPWRMVFPVQGASQVLELPPNSAINLALKKGDTLEIA